MVNNYNLSYVDLSYNKISSWEYDANFDVGLEANKIKATSYAPSSIDPISNQTYVTTLTVDTNRENSFREIAYDLCDFHDEGISADITNAIIAPTNNPTIRSKIETTLLSIFPPPYCIIFTYTLLF